MDRLLRKTRLAALLALPALSAAAPSPAEGADGASRPDSADGSAAIGTAVQDESSKSIRPSGEAPAAPEDLSLGNLSEAPEVSQLEESSAGFTVPKDRSERKYLEGLVSTPGHEEDLADVSDGADAFKAEAAEFSADIDQLIRRKFRESQERIENEYSRHSREVEAAERKERLDAIAAFEEFLKRYPDDPRYTPDALFRLAELYYEKSSDDFQVAGELYAQQYRLLEQGRAAVLPPEPKQDFQKSIAIYQRLLNRFPRYAHNDASQYLLGYCLEQQGEYPESRDAFNRLILRHPGSRFVPEAWMRIGEYYFDATSEPDALPRAAEAYEQAIRHKDHPLYDKALYKLGWVYYRMDDFARAVDTFVRLLDHYDALAAKSEGDAAASGGDLRNEALQYIAISLADDGWGSIQRAEELFQRLGGRLWEAELWRRLGDVYRDQTKLEDAIAAWRHNLAKAPLAPDAPLIHHEIFKAYDSGLRDSEKSFHELDVFSEAYGAGSPWHEANRNDSKALKRADDLVEQSLYASAVHNHSQAARYKEDMKADLAKATFAAAAKGYAKYLERFPHSKDAYELLFYMADCQYQSQAFDQAIESYDKVRDYSGERRHQSEAAYGAVLSRIRRLEQAQSTPGSGVSKPVVFTARTWPEGRAVQKKELHPMQAQLVDAIDQFLAIDPMHESAAKSAYRAAELFYAAEDFDEARKRFADLVSRWPSSEFATFASNLTLETFLITEDWVAVTRFTDQLTSPDEDGNVRVDPESEVGKSLRTNGDNAMFKRGEQLMKAEAWDEAGDVYEELVARNENYLHADMALNNAAVCREKGLRFDSALKLFERVYREYPDSPLAHSALFRVAFNAENSYDFDKAVESYQRLVEKYPDSPNRPASLHNMGILLEGLQRYDQAAKAFTRFAQLYPESPFAAADLFKAARIHQKTGDCRRQNQALEDFVARFGRDKNQDGLIVQAHKSMADCWRKLGNEKKALQSYQASTDEYVRRRLDGTYPDASAAASESRFQLAEVDFEKWNGVQLKGTQKQLETLFASKLTGAASLQKNYDDVVRFKSPDWIIAAFYRKANIYKNFASSLVESECPVDVRRRFGEEGCEEYKLSLTDKTSNLELTASSLFEQTVATCIRMGLVDSEWCARAEESLAEIRQDDSVLKKARPLFVAESAYPVSFVTMDGKDAAGMAKPSQPPDANGLDAPQEADAPQQPPADSEAPTMGAPPEQTAGSEEVPSEEPAAPDKSEAKAPSMDGSEGQISSDDGGNSPRASAAEAAFSEAAGEGGRDSSAPSSSDADNRSKASEVSEIAGLQPAQESKGTQDEGTKASVRGTKLGDDESFGDEDAAALDSPAQPPVSADPVPDSAPAVAPSKPASQSVRGTRLGDEEDF